MPKPKRPKKTKPPSLKQQFEHVRLALINTWLALPPERSTNFRRSRIGICSSAL